MFHNFYYLDWPSVGVGNDSQVEDLFYEIEIDLGHPVPIQACRVHPETSVETPDEKQTFMMEGSLTKHGTYV